MHDTTNVVIINFSLFRFPDGSFSTRRVQVPPRPTMGSGGLPCCTGPVLIHAPCPLLPEPLPQVQVLALLNKKVTMPYNNVYPCTYTVHIPQVCSPAAGSANNKPFGSRNVLFSKVISILWWYSGCCIPWSSLNPASTPAAPPSLSSPDYCPSTVSSSADAISTTLPPASLPQ